MINAGTLVRRRKRKRTMVVLECQEDWVLCGWFDKGRFYQRRFPVTELIMCTAWSDFWPVT
ncbi:hypothetical protein B2J69_21010 [Pantoea latae]|uniref:Uncharacterized protein n=1 Tax=Pantoea latae TaxID=1964541 RepID=A0A1V9DAC7_9GAMM|nr:hypothetical protein B2J69_21010 [Pantoea latae]